jgi:hypothetical protein
LRSQRLHTLQIAAIQLLAGLIWLLPVTLRPSGIPFWRGGEFSDLLISHWPNAWFIRHSLETWGQLPLWNPMILGGAPFAADPLSGMWYPPTWLAVLWPSGLAFSLLLWLHLAWAGAGMWLWLRRMQLSQPAALVGSLAFSGMPKLIGHIGLGHLGLVCAVCWTPWVFLAVAAAADRDLSARGGLRRSALAGALLGLVFLADPRWFLPLTILSAFVATWQVAHSQYGGGKLAGWAASRVCVAAIAALGIGAVLSLPLQELAALSTRSDLSRTEAAALQLPAARLLGVLAPDLGGWPEWQAYAGIVVIALGAAALLGRSRGAVFWAGLTLFCWLLALGDQTPLHALLGRAVPGYAWLRVPSRWLFGAGCCLAVLAALGFDRLVGVPLQSRERSRLNLGLFALVCLLLALGFVIWRSAPGAAFQAGLRRAIPFGLSAAWLGAVMGLIHPRLRGAIPSRWHAFGWVAILVLDLALVDLSEIQSRSPAWSENAAVAEIASRLQPGDRERAFSPSYSLPQPEAALAGLELVDGINPLQLRGLRDYMAGAAGFEPSGYSVTLPPFPDGDPRRPWGARPNPTLLGRLNVGYLVSAYPVEAEGWGFAGVSGGETIYRNTHARPRAWVELDGEGGPWRPVARLEWSPNRISIQAEGPGRLVVSEIDYPGWQVRLNGVEHALDPGSEPLRAVQLTTGVQQIEFIFRPWRVFAGAGITLVTLAFLAALWLVRA